MLYSFKKTALDIICPILLYLAENWTSQFVLSTNCECYASPKASLKNETSIQLPISQITRDINNTTELFV